MSKWWPIETAPLDTPVLVGPSKRMGMCVASLSLRDGWTIETPSDFVGIYPPKFWMPLPEPPK